MLDTKELVYDGVNVKETYQLGFYDALMIAAANKAGCKFIYTEDMNDGQTYGNVKVVNPFRSIGPGEPGPF